MWNSICKSYRFLVRFRSLLCLGHSLLRFKPFHCISGCRFRVVLLEGELHLSLKSSAASSMFLPCLTCVYRHISSHHLYMAFLSPVLRLICPEHHLPYVCCVPLFPSLSLWVDVHVLVGLQLVHPLLSRDITCIIMTKIDPGSIMFGQLETIGGIC